MVSSYVWITDVDGYYPLAFLPLLTSSATSKSDIMVGEKCSFEYYSKVLGSAFTKKNINLIGTAILTIK
jgi:hypothetical protein